MELVDAILGAFSLLSGLLLIERAFMCRRHERELERRDRIEADMARRIDDHRRYENGMEARFFELECRVFELEMNAEKER